MKIDLAELTRAVLARLDTETMKLGSSAELGSTFYRGVPGLTLSFKVSAILSTDSLMEALNDALTAQGAPIYDECDEAFEAAQAANSTAQIEAALAARTLSARP